MQAVLWFFVSRFCKILCSLSRCFWRIFFLFIEVLQEHLKEWWRKLTQFPKLSSLYQWDRFWAEKPFYAVTTRYESCPVTPCSAVFGPRGTEHPQSACDFSWCFGQGSGSSSCYGIAVLIPHSHFSARIRAQLSGLLYWFVPATVSFILYHVPLRLWVEQNDLMDLDESRILWLL